MFSFCHCEGEDLTKIRLLELASDNPSAYRESASNRNGELECKLNRQIQRRWKIDVKLYL